MGKYSRQEILSYIDTMNNYFQNYNYHPVEYTQHSLHVYYTEIIQMLWDSNFFHFTVKEQKYKDGISTISN